MARVSFFIDGFNLYHSLTENSSFHKYKWLNLEKLSRVLIPKNDNLVDVFYFTAYASWDPIREAKHRIYVNALRTVNVKPIFGEFRRRDKHCPNCRRAYIGREEKRTDVNIAIKLFETAIDNSWDKACIVSADSDLIPAIEAVKRRFPVKEVGVITPYGRSAIELKKIADFHAKIKEKHLLTCQFPDTIQLTDGKSIIKPASWV